MNLIPEQIGLAQKVRPKGKIKASWEMFLKDQVERDELREWASRVESAQLYPDNLVYEKKPFISLNSFLP